jgi:hypothetical protein
LICRLGILREGMPMGGRINDCGESKRLIVMIRIAVLRHVQPI